MYGTPVETLPVPPQNPPHSNTGLERVDSRSRSTSPKRGQTLGDFVSPSKASSHFTSSSPSLGGGGSSASSSYTPQSTMTSDTQGVAKILINANTGEAVDEEDLCAVFTCSGVKTPGTAGYCATHYKLHLLTLEEPNHRRRNSGLDGLCAAPNCRGGIFKAGFCNRHYHNHQRNLVDNISAGGAKTPEQDHPAPEVRKDYGANSKEIVLLMARARKEEEERKRDKELRESYRQVAEQNRHAAALRREREDAPRREEEAMRREEEERRRQHEENARRRRRIEEEDERERVRRDEVRIKRERAMEEEEDRVARESREAHDRHDEARRREAAEREAEDERQRLVMMRKKTLLKDYLMNSENVVLRDLKLS